jgi:hypothetical protein
LARRTEKPTKIALEARYAGAGIKLKGQVPADVMTALGRPLCRSFNRNEKAVGGVKEMLEKFAAV